MSPRSGPPDPGGAARPSRSNEPAYLAVGRLRRPHGLRGEIQMEVLTDFPERLRRGMTLYIGSDYEKHKVRSLRQHDQLMLVAFDGYQTPEEVGELRNQIVYIPASAVPPLEEGEYYHHQLIGLQVYDDEDQLLGMVADILETGSNDVLVVRSETRPELLLPMIDEVLLEIDLKQGRIKVHLMPGLQGE